MIVRSTTIFDQRLSQPAAGSIILSVDGMYFSAKAGPAAARAANPTQSLLRLNMRPPPFSSMISRCAEPDQAQTKQE